MNLLKDVRRKQEPGSKRNTVEIKSIEKVDWNIKGYIVATPKNMPGY